MVFKDIKLIGAISYMADRCYKLHGYPPGYRQKGGQRNPSQSVSTVPPMSSGTHSVSSTTANAVSSSIAPPGSSTASLGVPDTLA